MPVLADVMFRLFDRGDLPELVELRADVPPRIVEQHLTPEDVAARLQVHPRTVVAWIRSGRLSRARRLGHRTYRVRCGRVFGGAMQCKAI